MSDYEKTKAQVLKRQQEAEQYAAGLKSIPAADGYSTIEQYNTCAPPREHSSSLVLKRARGLRDESALYFWLASALERDKPSKEVEAEIYNLLTRGYTPRAY